MIDQRRMAPFVTGVVVVALIVAATFWATRPHTSAAPDQVASDAGRPDPMTERRYTRTPAPEPLAPVAPVSPSDFLATLAANDAAVSKVAEAGKAKLRSRYESERVDPAWASNKQLALERLGVSAQIEQLDAAPLSITASCRTSVCLIHADFSSRLAATDWYTLYALNAGTEMFSSSSTTTINADGSVHLQIYGLARQ